mgnify:CR=1 FL=1
MMATANVELNLLLQLTLLHLLAWLAATLLIQPRHRFCVWLGVLLLSGAAWLRFLWHMAFPSRPVLAIPSPMVDAVPHFQATVSLPLLTLYWRDSFSRVGTTLPRLYLLALTCFVAGALWRQWQLRRIVGSGQPPTSALQRRFEELCGSLGLRRCRLVLLPVFTSPTTTGCWRPMVLLPDALANDLSEPSLAWVLRHELIHIRRWDYVWNRLAAAVCAVLFFHPLVWLAWKRMQQERELACDEAVVRLDRGGRPDYADCLMQMAKWRMLSAARWREVGFTRSGSVLALRIRALLRRRTPTASRAHSLVAGLGLLSLLLGPLFLPALEFRFAVPTAMENPAPALPTHLRQPPRAIGYNSRRAPTRPRRHPSGETVETVETVAHVFAPNLPAYDLGGAPPVSLPSASVSHEVSATPDNAVQQPSSPVPATHDPEVIAAVRSPAPSGRAWPGSTKSPSVTRSGIVIGVVAGIARAVSMGGGGQQVDGENFGPR